MKKISYNFLIFTLLAMPMLVRAQSFTDWGGSDLDEANLGTRSLRDTIAGVINIVLGFLGIIATVGIIYGGFVYMTSGGNSDKASSGQSAMTAGAIGLVIILTAYAISRFVLQSLANETV